ncbi:replication stress response regulator SDE2 [Daktulosphaira vitifoliae]|uniref:replication stress response regulator SDE2 n=1 Tax=Daktulosphaira vitifoliae TaxID=58002 RepID=UPI0021AA98CE|nr:replication stress response regulator SDE2 [Daktulosphaira vitifoliae]
MLDIKLNIVSEINTSIIRQYICAATGMLETDFYMILNGKILNETIVKSGTVQIVPRLLGGKGGFGSMLRAIGAQIEKTTNREACRDLSGRRLRDINEEKRVKEFLAKGNQSTEDPEERKKRKLQRLCQKPKTEFKDEHYEKNMSEMAEFVSEAVEYGLKAGTSEPKKKKKARSKGYFDSDLDTDSSSDLGEEKTDSDEKVSLHSNIEPEITTKRKNCELEEELTSLKKIKQGN